MLKALGQVVRLRGLIPRSAIAGLSSTELSWPGILNFMNEITRIFTFDEEVHSQAAAQLLLLVYDELRKLAAGYLAND
jgi:hypothetical protein